MIYLILFAIYLFLCLAVASKAKNRGKSFFLWFIIAIVLDPILPYVLLAVTE